MKTRDAQRLIQKAVAAAKGAHCPYSRFRVGAALLTKEGGIFTGCNVENASYGLTICAERSAVAAAVGAGKRKFEALAIVASGSRPAYPCGACLQVLAEFAGSELIIVVAPIDRPAAIEAYRLGDFLPKAFTFKK